MDPLLRELVRLHDEGAPHALGLVVHASGSTPQKTGARAIFLPGGEILGTLGGGCMEAEARLRGLQLVRGGDPQLMELHLDDDFGWDDGLICGGSAHIFLQPAPADQVDLFRACESLHESGERGVLCLLPEGPEGAAGRYWLYREGREMLGEGGSPELRAAVAQAAEAVLASGREDPHRVRLQDPAVALYLEPLVPRPVCLIAGAGHIGAALCHYAARVGFDVTVVDDRPSLVTEERLPDASRRIAAPVVETVRDWPVTPDTYIVLVTRGHRNDAAVLRESVGRGAAYLGMIGSRRKVITIYKEFIEQGLASADQLSRIHAPIGLDIGAVAVEEIALCIAAEMVMVRRRGAGDEGRPDDDRSGGGREPSNGAAEAALAVRESRRHSGGRPLAEGLPSLSRDRGAGTPG